jgi:hypothetical protein
MTFHSRSIDSLLPIGFPIRAELAAILSSLGTAHPDWVVPAFDHLVVAFLYPVASVVPSVLAPLHPSGLGETEERTDQDSDKG